jgi:hypothetical protein
MDVNTDSGDVNKDSGDVNKDSGDVNIGRKGGWSNPDRY